MEKIIVKDKEDLNALIKQEVYKNGNECDLNHIDLSHFTHLNWIFFGSSFNGDISMWDVSQVKNMEGMFFRSKFNGDISSWDVSQVKDMRNMFADSQFNRTISGWNVSHVEKMNMMFKNSQFNMDISGWNNMGLAEMRNMFKDYDIQVPWWYTAIEGKEDRMEEVKKRHKVMNLNKKLNQQIMLNDNVDKKYVKEKKAIKL